MRSFAQDLEFLGGQIDDFCGAPLLTGGDAGRGACCDNDVNGQIGNDCDLRGNNGMKSCTV